MKTIDTNKAASECFWGRHYFTSGKCSKCGMDQNNQVRVTGRRWFSRTYGNTYHSVTVTMPNGDTLACPYEYGYGDQYQDTAMRLIAAHIGAEVVENDRLNTLLLRSGYYCEPRVLDVDRKCDLAA